MANVQDLQSVPQHDHDSSRLARCSSAMTQSARGAAAGPRLETETGRRRAIPCGLAVTAGRQLGDRGRRSAANVDCEQKAAKLADVVAWLTRPKTGVAVHVDSSAQSSSRRATASDVADVHPPRRRSTASREVLNHLPQGKLALAGCRTRAIVITTEDLAADSRSSPRLSGRRFDYRRRGEGGRR